jgi:hypothetical protein
MRKHELFAARHGRLAPARTTSLVLLLATTALPALAQVPEQWCTDQHAAPGLYTTSFGVYGTNGGPSGCAVQYQTVASGTAWNQDYGGPDTYFSVPAGTGIQEFTVKVNYFSYWPAYAHPYWIVKVDGQTCASCTAELQPGSAYIVNTNDVYNEVTLKVRHTASYAWPDGVREFSLEPGFGSPPNVTPIIGQELRFKAVMIGTTFTEIQGYYNAPAMPLYILRDPPGDASYSSITNVSDVCSGTTSSMTTGNSQNGYFKARLGVAGTIPFVGLDYEIYGEVGVDLAASQSETSSNEYQTCLSTSATYNTPMTGAPDDVFIGSAVRYAYGQAIITTRPACGTVVLTNEFASAPVGTLMSYNYTESTIREDVIPDLIADIAGMAPGAERDRAETQLSVWYQTLAMNDAIKADAPFDVLRNFDGGGNGQTYSLTSSTTDSYSIEYDSQLESGLTFEFGVNLGGSGITAGGGAHFQQGYGRGETGSNVATNSVEYHLEDDDASDQFSVRVFRDEVFGTYVFALDSAQSRTSCSYEGGYQLDQPQLWIGSMGSSHAMLNEVTIGGNAIFPIYVCNNSNFERTYLLTSDANSNPLGGIISGYNGITSGSTVTLTVPANDCAPVGNIYLSQPDNSVVDFEGLLLTLSSACGDGVTSSASISAHFGAGNFGSYCQPSSVSGPALGDYVDGVVLSSLANTGSGNVAGASYTDYSGQSPASISRNAHLAIAITAGTATGDHFAAWIDYDRDGEFAASEKLGEFVNSAAGETQNIAFIVPLAPTGATILRVRGVHVGNGEPSPVDPCYSYVAGETEDYAVIINANDPADCNGVPNGTAYPGTACSDGNADTGNDTWTANCQCTGQLIDCAGVPGGFSIPGTLCDDNNPATGFDTYDANCLCIGVAYDCEGVVGGTATPGSPCNDANADTGNDVFDANCQCAGQLYDCLGVAGGATVPGSGCDDANAATTGDVYNAFCQCAGTLANDCEGVLGGPAQPGTACDDGDLSTGNDVYSTGCICAGLPFDCAGVAGGSASQGTPCDDGNPLSIDDVYDANCACIGTLEEDCAGVPGGTAQPGTACDDANAETGNDVYNAFCECAGQLIDCLGEAGGTALPGAPCDDGIAATENDAYTVGCVCEGVVGAGIAPAAAASTVWFTVQPNPNNGFFQLRPLGTDATPVRISVRNGLGQDVLAPFSANGQRIIDMDLNNVAPGAYYLVMVRAGEQHFEKVMIQR